MILSVGELLMDISATGSVDGLSSAIHFEAKPGGSPANFAYGCKKLGAETVLAATVGEDGFGEQLVKYVHNLGISTEYIHQTAFYNTSLIIIGNKGATPEFIPYRGADCYIEPVNDELINRCRLIHSTSFALSKSPAQYRILDAMQKAFEAGKLVSIDWNYSLKIWGADNDAQAIFEQVMRYAPLLKLSLDDVERFWGTDVHIQEAMNRVNRYATTAACITCGSKGVWYRLPEGSWQHRAAKPITVNNPTGAGDSFWSGFITGYLDGASIEHCIDLAMETASLKLQDKL